jgi:polysaccharide biosynthesis protein PelC
MLKLVLPLAFSLLLYGCAGPWSRGPEFPSHRQSAPPPSGPVCRVAVLPFLNDSDYPLADSIVYKVFAAQFQLSSNSLVVQEGDILKLYQQLRIWPGQAPTPEQLRILASRLGAQVLITGTVMEMRENPGLNASSNPVLAVDVRLLHGESGDLLWGTFHRRQGTDYRTAMHFGTIHTVTGLSRQVALEIINLWYKKGFSRCDISPPS